MIVVCIRRTLPWEDEDAAMAALEPGLVPKAALWNATVSIRYAPFRSRLKQIALENVSRVANAKLVPLEDAPPGALVVPMDDDDWLSPDLANRLLAEHDPACDGIVWTRSIFEANRRASWLRWLLRGSESRRDTSRWTCATNNYAVRNHGDIAEVVGDHTRASIWFEARARRIQTIHAHLSVQNRNPASKTALSKWGGRLYTREELIASLERHRALYRRVRLSRELAWAKPHLAAMRELIAELRVR
jgi:hypothetical protein